MFLKLAIIGLIALPLGASAQTRYFLNGTPCGSNGSSCMTITSGTSNAAIGAPYTLVLRDRLRKTVLIRGIYAVASVGKDPEEACKSIATVLKASPDIEAADCFQ
jgi:hypothetical protein